MKPYAKQTKTSVNMIENYFQGLKINFHVMKINFHVMKIYFHGLKIVFSRVGKIYSTRAGRFLCPYRCVYNS